MTPISVHFPKIKMRMLQKLCSYHFSSEFLSVYKVPLSLFIDQICNFIYLYKLSSLLISWWPDLQKIVNTNFSYSQLKRRIEVVVATKISHKYTGKQQKKVTKLRTISNARTLYRSSPDWAATLINNIQHHSTIIDIIWQYLTLLDNIRHYSTKSGIIWQYSSFFYNTRFSYKKVVYKKVVLKWPKP